MLSFDLAKLYGVETRALTQAVKRNAERFPDDFMFRLTNAETEALLSQYVIPQSRQLGGSLPLAFTEHGVAMLSTVLRSPRALSINIEIIRAFVRFRQMIGTNTELSKRLAELEKRYDGQFAVVFRASKQLMSPPEKPRRKIGY